MKILFLTSQPPCPPVTGGAMRSWSLIQAAARRHEVHLLSFADGPAPSGADSLRSVCVGIEWVPAPERSPTQRLRQLVWSREPDMAHRRWSPAFATLVLSRLRAERFDLVQAESIEMARYGLLARESGHPRGRLVFDDLNAEYLLQRSACIVDARRPARWPRAAYSLVQWQRLARYEACVCTSADLTLAVSPEDLAALRVLAPHARMAVVPNAVDTAVYTRWDGEPADLGRRALLFSGKLDYRPNVDALEWFCAAVLPRLAACVSDVQLVVVGRDPGPPVRRLASPWVRIVGPVPDMRPYLAGAALYVVPMRMGGGVRFKVLEAWAMGKAVVATPLGASGLGAVDREHLRVAADARNFAAATLDLLGDPAERWRLGKAGRELVESRYDTRVVASSLLDLYEQVAHAHARFAGADCQE